ncbi:MAG TPA: energy transducer TonB [Thermoanaerobaculia bacterium]|nr:energy transducer TonB [Thermoanaerobaculia bacterium]
MHRPAILALFLLTATLTLPHAGQAAGSSQPSPGDPQSISERLKLREDRLQGIDTKLRQGEWAAAEAEARAVFSDAMLKKAEGSFEALGRLALAEAAQGHTEEALRHWEIAQNLKLRFDPKPFGAPGELLAGHPLRQVDEAPATLAVRHPGDGGPAYTPARLRETKKVEIPAVWGTIPRGVQLQVIVDGQGRAAQPVLLASTSIALSYAFLSSIKDWRFEPARSGETAVASFYELKLPLEHRPLTQVAEFTGSPLAAPEASLHAGNFQEAGKQVGKAWSRAMSDTTPSRGFLGVALALKALAQAGSGDEDGAICRWQAAQTLEPRLYGANLEAYGAAGKLLSDHPWGEPLGEINWVAELKKRVSASEDSEVQRPELLKKKNPSYPEYARQERSNGTVFVESIINSAGKIRNPVLLTSGTLPGMEANALDAICDWRFKPALYKGQSVPVYYMLTIKFTFERR